MLRQIIPFKKELLLNTKINEVTSISLEHTLSLKDDNSIKGDFIVSGDYKMTASSINREKFKFNLPVEIELDDSYDYEKAIVDIDNFYYEIVNDDTIKVNIDVYVDADKIKKENDIETSSKTDVVIVDEEDSSEDNKDSEEILTNDIAKENNSDNESRFDINIDSNIDIDVNNIKNNNNIGDKEEIEQAVSYKKNKMVDLSNVVNNNDEINTNDNVNLFNTDSFSNETYATYYVYIVKEDDTIDKILEKFKTNKEELINYNDLSDIKKGTKLIIPISTKIWIYWVI